MLSPMQLNNYFVEELVIRQNSAFDPSPIERNEGRITCNIDFGRAVQAEEHFKLGLTIGVEPALTPPALDPYTISIKIVGFFSFPQTPKLSFEEMSKLVSLNGASILLGLARGLVAQSTGVGQFGKYLLPPINLVEVWEKVKTESMVLAQQDQNVPQP
jgi:preprotein translocase subunit SecB